MSNFSVIPVSFINLLNAFSIPLELPLGSILTDLEKRG